MMSFCNWSQPCSQMLCLLCALLISTKVASAVYRPEAIRLQGIHRSISRTPQASAVFQPSAMAASTGDGYGFAVPMLFNLEPAANTPHTPHTQHRESGTISSARRSVTPPGSMHTDTTPPRAPPTQRLQDIIMTGGSPVVVCRGVLKTCSALYERNTRRPASLAAS